jgi:hypothetical protein
MHVYLVASMDFLISSISREKKIMKKVSIFRFYDLYENCYLKIWILFDTMISLYHLIVSPLSWNIKCCSPNTFVLTWMASLRINTLAIMIWIIIFTPSMSKIWIEMRFDILHQQLKTMKPEIFRIHF